MALSFAVLSLHREPIRKGDYEPIRVCPGGSDSIIDEHRRHAVRAGRYACLRDRLQPPGMCHMASRTNRE